MKGGGGRSRDLPARSMAPPMQLLLVALLISGTAFAQSSIPPGAASPAPSPFSGAPSPLSPFHSPPAPPADDEDLPPDYDAPTPSPASPSPLADSPSSEPPLPSDEESGVPPQKVDQESSLAAQAKATESGGGGMSGGHKAGLAVGLFLAAALVGVGAFVYKKRQDNLRRAQYGIQMT